jgi:hypothetical protein
MSPFASRRPLLLLLLLAVPAAGAAMFRPLVGIRSNPDISAALRGLSRLIGRKATSEPPATAGQVSAASAAPRERPPPPPSRAPPCAV